MASKNGLEEFRRKLMRVPAAIRAEVDKANAQNAEEWVQAAKAAVPRDPEDGTPLADSIRHYKSDTGGQIVRAGGQATTKPSAGGPFDYATAQEFGTVKQTPNPFFWPTYRLLRKKFNSRRRRALNKAVKDFNDGR